MMSTGTIDQLLKISLFEDEQVAYKAWKPHGVHNLRPKTSAIPPDYPDEMDNWLFFSDVREYELCMLHFREIKCIIRKFENDTKLSGVIDIPEGQDALQRVLDKLKETVHGNLMRFNKAKSKVLHLGQGKAWYQYRLGN
ncbi:hypothetical protein TURU_002410 [Turdus rufiventris]|nr:hypothetical protein TURU_002410 [Turdus rufiventris]